MIEFINIGKQFGENKVLTDVSHVMQTGQCNLIIGTSGFVLTSEFEISENGTNAYCMIRL